MWVGVDAELEAVEEAESTDLAPVSASGLQSCSLRRSTRNWRNRSLLRSQSAGHNVSTPLRRPGTSS